jgi:hypothetical protein
MTAPTVQVKIAFTYVGGLPVWWDVTQYLIGSVPTSRGRSLETDQYNAGTMTVTLLDNERLFDPSNTSSIHYPQVIPGIEIQLFVDGLSQFRGIVNDIQNIYSLPNLCTTVLTCLEGPSLLANCQIGAGTTLGRSFSQHYSGQRISAVLALPEVAYPLGAIVATGQSLLQASTSNVLEQDALSYCQTCAASEVGYLFCDNEGLLQFHDRYYIGTLTSSVLFSDVPADLAAGAIGYAVVEQNSQALLLFNQVTGTRSGGVLQTANDLASQTQYRLRCYPLPTLENETDALVLDLCGYTVGRYSTPNVRFGSVSLDLQSLTSTQLAAILALDLCDLVTVKRTPAGSGTPATITSISYIDQISLALNVSSSTYTITFALGSVDTRSFFILNDPVFGTLDSGNRLNF